MAPRVSVLMPCFNGAAHLRGSISSLLAQSYSDFELIVVDDGSTDDSARIAREWGDARIRVIEQANRGVSAARNRGLADARGEFVAYLDVDDAWDSTFLERMVNALEAHPNAAIAYCGWQNVGLPGGRGTPFVPPDYETPDKASRLIESCRWPIHAALTRRRFIEATGGFDTRLAVGEDFLLWMEIGVFHQVVRVPEVLAYYRFHGAAQASSDQRRAALQGLQAQRIFLRRNADVAARLGRRHVREITLRPLLRKAYESYWKRDLVTARALFIAVMKQGYGRLADWKYMLPSLLPRAIHERLVRRWERKHKVYPG